MASQQFADKMALLSQEAIDAREEVVRQRAAQVRRDRIKQVMIFAVVVGLYAVAFFHRTEISDTVARLIGTQKSEYQELALLSADDPTCSTDTPGAPVDPASRKAKLREAMKRAKEHSAMVDSIMDYNPEADKPSEPPQTPKP